MNDRQHGGDTDGGSPFIVFDCFPDEDELSQYWDPTSLAAVFGYEGDELAAALLLDTAKVGSFQSGSMPMDSWVLNASFNGSTLDVSRDDGGGAPVSYHLTALLPAGGRYEAWVPRTELLARHPHVVAALDLRFAEDKGDGLGIEVFEDEEQVIDYGIGVPTLLDLLEDRRKVILHIGGDEIWTGQEARDETPDGAWEVTTVDLQRGLVNVSDRDYPAGRSKDFPIDQLSEWFLSGRMEIESDTSPEESRHAQ